MTVLVIFGGVTTEHEVSVVTAAQAMAAMDDYKIVPVHIGHDGVWRYDKEMTTVEKIKKTVGKEVHLRPSSPYLYCGNKKVARIDAVLSCMHGLHGEDGLVAAWAQTSDLPYGCSGLAASAVGMDKVLTKYFLRGLGIACVDGVAVRRSSDAARVVADRGLAFPLIVKPSRLGSSIGIAMAHDEVELAAAVSVALCYDERVLIEEGITDRKEYNCAALGTADAVTVGEIEEVGGMDEILSFADKYLRGGKVKGMDNCARRIADIPTRLKKEIELYTQKIFTALEMRGVVRVDFLYDAAKDVLYVNEVNIVPGSLAYYLFPSLGMEGVIKTVLNDAKACHRREKMLVTDYCAEIAHGK